MAGNLSDKRNVVGLGNLMRGDGSETTDIDIKEYEDSIIKGEDDLKVEEAEIIKKFNKEMLHLQKSLGIEVDGIASGSGAGKGDRFSQDDESDSGSEYSDDKEYSVTDRYQDMRPKNDDRERDRNRDHSPDRDLRDSRDSQDYDRRDYSPRDLDKEYNNIMRHGRYPGEQHSMGIDTNYTYRTPLPPTYDRMHGQSQMRFDDPYMRNMTVEQERRQHLNRVIGDIGPPNAVNLNYGLTEEREYDDKNAMLEEIDDLIEIAEDNGIDISRIPKIDKNSTFAEVREVYNKLRYKNDSHNYDQFANEIFMLFAYGAEYLFDGEKEWFGKHPDLTGWSDTVKTKLRRMRYEKTKLVRKIVDQYQIPPWLRIGMEIIPSAFTYTRHRRSAVRDNIASDRQFKSALNQLNTMSN